VSTTGKDIVCPAPSRGCSRRGGGTGDPRNGQTPKQKGGGLNEENPGFAGDVGAAQAATSDGPLSIGLLALVALALGLVTAVMIPLLRAWRRRRRLRAARAPRELIVATYDVFGERAGELGRPRRAGETPQEYRARLVAVEGFGEDDRGRLERMTGAVVRAAYAPAEPDAAASHETSADARAVLHALRSATPLHQRVLGVYRRD
jgi:hypothetical protein